MGGGTSRRMPTRSPQCGKTDLMRKKERIGRQNTQVSTSTRNVTVSTSSIEKVRPGRSSVPKAMASTIIRRGFIMVAVRSAELPEKKVTHGAMPVTVAKNWAEK